MSRTSGARSFCGKVRVFSDGEVPSGLTCDNLPSESKKWFEIHGHRSAHPRQRDASDGVLPTVPENCRQPWLAIELPM